MAFRCRCGREISTFQLGEGDFVECPDCGRRFRAEVVHDSASGPPPAKPSSNGSTLPLPRPPSPSGKRSHKTRWLVIAACVVSVLLLVVVGVVLLFLPLLAKQGEEAKLVACKLQLQSIYAALDLYATENRGFYPPLPSGDPGRLMPAVRLLYPQYVSDGRDFVCPAQGLGSGNSDRVYFDDRSYVYLSHALTNEADGMAFIAAYKSHIARGLSLDQDFTYKTADGETKTLRRLRQGIEHLMARDPLDSVELRRIRAHVPVMVEWPGHHAQSGGNVLYLDGHVAFVKYPGPFPMTREFIQGLRSLKTAALTPSSTANGGQDARAGNR